MLIFDSGVGGFSILKDIKNKLPHINYIYFLDNQAFPYGDKKNSFIIKRSINIIETVKKIYPINIVLIACNTASTISLSILRRKFNLPIIGVLPQIQDAEKYTKNKIIGLIATQATINSTYVKNIIYKKSFNSVLKIIVTNKLSLISEKKMRNYFFDIKELEKIFNPWMNISIKPDTIILGCTHFILIKKEIKDILDNSIFFIDSKKSVISQIKKHFDKSYAQQKIKNNIFLYSKKNQDLKNLLFFLEDYDFEITENINLN